MVKDYYQTLGVKKTATSDEIKKAYRTLAMKYHPDKNPGDKTAEEKFKNINEAHKILKDPQKRKNLDNFGDPDGRPRPTGGFSGFNTDGFDDIFRGVNVNTADDIFKHFGVRFSHAAQARNPDVISDLYVSLEDAFSGKNIPIEIFIPGTGAKKFKVDVPKGAESNLRLKMAGKGSAQNTRLAPGDLYISLHIQEHSIFKRMRADLIIDKELTMIDAALGCDIKIPTIEGKEIKVTIPPGTQPNHKIRLKSKGMPLLRQSTIRGDMYINIIITVPTNLTKKQKQLLEDFKQESVKLRN